MAHADRRSRKIVRATCGGANRFPEPLHFTRSVGAASDREIFVRQEWSLLDEWLGSGHGTH